MDYGAVVDELMIAICASNNSDVQMALRVVVFSRVPLHTLGRGGGVGVSGEERGWVVGGGWWWVEVERGGVEAIFFLEQVDRLKAPWLKKATVSKCLVWFKRLADDHY